MKKGFLSTSMVYSFFLVFLMVLIFILANLINNRTLVSRINSDIKESIYSSSFSGYLINNDIDNLVYHNNDELNDNSYRFVGDANNNYVCFATDITPCPAENLYRIIGVIDGKVKLIKDTPITNFAIDEVTSIYSATDLVTYLNTSNESNYYDTILVYSDLIATTYYYIGGISSLSSDRLEVYNAEMSSSSILRQVGLMYISDYLYAEDSGNNWLRVNADTWFITQNASDIVDGEYPINNYYYLNTNGEINLGAINLPKNIKPVFYLKNSVKILSGSGMSDDPYYVGGNNV